MIRVSSRHPIATILTILTMMAVAPAAKGQYKIDMRNGSSVKGWVTEDDGSQIKVRLDTGGQGGAFATYEYDKLAPRTIYRLLKSRTKNEDADGQLKLASYALDNDLFMVARMHYRSALKADEAQGGRLAGKLEKLRNRAAGTVLERSQKKLAAGEELQAEKDLALILKYLPTSPEAEKARQLIEGLSEKAMEKRREQRQEMAQTKSAKVRKRLQGLNKNYEKAHEYVRSGLKTANRATQSIKLYEQAISEYDRCLKALKKADAEVQGDEEFSQEVRAWITTVSNDRVDAQLNIASAYFTRQTLTKALSVVNSILADDPDNSRAQEMRGRIEVASNDSWGRRRR